MDRKTKKGFFFSLDAVIALVLLLGVLLVIPVFYISNEEKTPIIFYSSDVVQLLSTIRVGDIDDASIQAMLNESNEV